MKTIKYFNVYKSALLSVLYKEDVFVEQAHGITGPSDEHRTVTGPFHSMEEAISSFRHRGASNKFLKTIQVVMDLE